MKIRKRSLDDINDQFQIVLDRLGIASDQQTKMQNLSLDLKMKVIISLDTQCSKEQNIKIHLNYLKQRNSLLNILSLKSIMNEGNDAYFEIFKANNGLSILEELTYKILFDTEEIYDTNKALYDVSHYEKLKENGTSWFENGFNIEYDFQMYYAMGKSKNMYNSPLNDSSRENLLNEVLGCILSISKKYNFYNFNIARIVRNVYLFVYTKNFYDLIDLYAENAIENLKFLFYSEKKHLCVVNTYFYDIYRENSEFPAVDYFLKNPKYKNIVVFILSEIKNELKRGPMNNEKGGYKNPSNLKQIDFNQRTIGGEQNKIEESSIDRRKLYTQSNASSADIDTSGEELMKTKNNTIEKLRIIINSLDNAPLVNIIPCYLESLITDPDRLKDSSETSRLIKENEKLKGENERLRLTINNMENKSIAVKEKIQPQDIPLKIKEPVIVVEEKLSKMSTKPKKMPFKKKVAVKECNIHLIPYTKKIYNPLRWCKSTKNGNIWEEINNTMKYDKLTQIFTLEDLSCYEKRLNSTEKLEKHESTVKTIFPEKKGQAISIALGRIKLTDQEMKTYIFQLNESKFGENMIRQLVKNYPKKDEFELLKALKLEIDKKPQPVGRAEQFYIEFLYCQEELYRNLTAIYFKMSYPTNASAIREMIVKLTKIYKCALESNAIKEFCRYTLFLGNIFNQNTFSGNAEGYSFESITAIIDYSGSNKEKLLEDVLNKMHYDLINDLKLLTAENIKYDGLCMHFNDTLSDHNLIKLNDDIEIYLRPMLEDFKELKSTFKELNELYARFSKYFSGENIFDIFKLLLQEILKKK